MLGSSFGACVVCAGGDHSRESLVDVKTKTCDAKYPTADGTACAVVTRRATEASQAYLIRARRLDTDLGTLPGA